MKRICKIISLCLVLFIGVINVPCFADTSEYPTLYKVTASSLNVRFAPGAQFDTFFKLKYGEEVYGKQSVDGWTEINCYGFKGFVFSKYLKDKNSTEDYQKNYSGNQRYLGTYKITGYNPYCSHCCGKSNGITASGKRAVVGETVAMKGVPFGTRIYIKGLGYYTVHDRGVGYGKVDVACGSHSACYAITGSYEVYILE